MHRLVFQLFRRLGASALGPPLQRFVTLMLGALGILALSGSQTFNSANAAPNEPGRSEQGSPALVSPTAPAWSLPTPYPTSSLPLGALPSGTASANPAANPYGLPNTTALTASGIPEPAYKAYVAAATELARTDPSCGLKWSLIAGIGRVESNHGRYGGSTINADGLVTPSILGIRLDGSRAGTARITDSDNGKYDGDTAFDRAVGPMQFLPGTWKSYGGGANPQNMNAAALATGRYLCAGSASTTTQQGRWAAVYRYNHSDSYVSLVLSLADSYESGHDTPFPTRPSGTTPSPTNEPPATTPGPPPAVPIPPTAPIPPTPTPSPTGTPTASPTGKPTPTTAPPATTPPVTTPPMTTTTTTPPATTLPATTPPATTPPATTPPATTPPATTPPVTTAPPTTPPASPAPATAASIPTCATGATPTPTVTPTPTPTPTCTPAASIESTSIATPNP